MDNEHKPWPSSKTATCMRLGVPNQQCSTTPDSVVNSIANMMDNPQVIDNKIKSAMVDSRPLATPDCDLSIPTAKSELDKLLALGYKIERNIGVDQALLVKNPIKTQNNLLCS